MRCDEGDGRDQQADCSKRHARTAWSRSARQLGIPADGLKPFGDQEGSVRARNRVRARLN